MIKYTVLCFNYSLMKLGKQDKIEVKVIEINEFCAKTKAKQLSNRNFCEILKIEEI